MRLIAIIFIASLLATSNSAYALGGSTCATATVVGALPYSDGGQLESGVDPNCPGQPVNDRFYVFTAPYASTFRFDMCGSNSCCFQQMRLWTDGTCCSGASVTVDSGCGDGYPQYELAMTAAQVVYIEVGKSGSEWGVAPLYQFHVADLSMPPAGATCIDAITVGALPYTYGGQLQSGTNDDCTGEPVNDLFFVFTAPQAATYRFDMCGSDSCCDHQIRIWTDGTCCSGASTLVSNGCGGGKPQYDLSMITGQVVYIEIGKSGAALPTAPFYVLHVTDLTPPPPPPGATCSDPILINSLPYYNSGPLQSGDTNDDCPGGPVNDIFYEFTAPYGGGYQFNVCSIAFDYPYRIRLWSDGACCAGVPVEMNFTCSWQGQGVSSYLSNGQHVILEIGVPGPPWASAPNYEFQVFALSAPGSTCDAAIVVNGLPYNVGGFLDSDPYSPGCSGGPFHDLFYEFTAPYDGTFRFDMCNSDSLCEVSYGPCAPHTMRVWTGGTCCSGDSVVVSDGCSDGSPLLDLAMTAGQTAYFELGVAWPVAAYQRQFWFNARALPPNDQCPGTVIPALPYTDSGSTAAATHQYSGSCYAQSAPDVVYHYTPAESVFVRASMSADWIDCMQVRKNNCATGASLQCDFGEFGESSWFDFWAEPDSTYYFVLDGVNDWDFGPYTFTLQEITFIPNDLCPGTVVPNLPYTDSGSTATATHQYNGSCYTQSAPDVVYNFTPTDSVLLRASLVAPWFDCMQVRKNNCATGASLQCDYGLDADSSWFLFWAEPDSTYYFILDGAYIAEFGPFTFTLQESYSYNDLCPGILIPSLPYTDSGSTEAATHQFSGLCLYAQATPDVVYNFTSTDSVLVGASMAASWSEGMYVLRNNCITGAVVACEYGLDAEDSTMLNFWAEPDSTYYFILDGAYYDTDFGSYTFTLRETALLPNDLCPGTVVPNLPYTDSGSTATATHQYNGICYTQAAPDVVYHYTPVESVFVRASMTADWFDCLQVRKNNCATGASLQCDFGEVGDSSWFQLWVEPDSTYYFILDGAFNTDLGPYTFTLQESYSYNDLCPGISILSLPYADSGSTAFAFHQYNGICYTQSAPDVVYNFTSADSVLVRASMVATWFDCMHVRRNDCANGASIQCDFGSGPDSSWFDFIAEPDSTYFFIVDGAFNNDFGPYTFTLTNLSCPAPGSMVITTSGNDAILRWQHVECDTPLYSIYRNDSLDVQAIPANLIGTTTDSTFTDVGILSGGDLRNFYVVTAE